MFLFILQHSLDKLRLLKLGSKDMCRMQVIDSSGRFFPFCPMPSSRTDTFPPCLLSCGNEYALIRESQYLLVNYWLPRLHIKSSFFLMLLHSSTRMNILLLVESSLKIRAQKLCKLIWGAHCSSRKKYQLCRTFSHILPIKMTFLFSWMFHET